VIKNQLRTVPQLPQTTQTSRDEETINQQKEMEAGKIIPLKFSD